MWRVGAVHPFSRFDAETRTIIYTSNMIESLDAPLSGQPTGRRSHFPKGRLH
jgi:transposase-like protein